MAMVVVVVVLTLCGPRERELLRGLHVPVRVRDGVRAVVAARQEMRLGHDAFAAVVGRNLPTSVSTQQHATNTPMELTLNAPMRLGASLP